MHVARWVGALICLSYGFAKLNGSQFTVLDSELYRPMGEVSGFWLTWYYYGYSKAYGSLIAGIQIGGGFLLMWPRGALIGALLLIPVAANIALTDVFFGVNALGMAVLLLTCLAFIVVPHAGRLLRAVKLDPPPTRSRWVLPSALCVAATWGFTYWVANFNNRSPTEIDGVWSVEGENRPVDRVFFERNRAHLAVFRQEARSDARRHFEVDSAGVVRVWERWLQKGDLVYTGQVVGPNRIDLWLESSPRDTVRLSRER